MDHLPFHAVVVPDPLHCRIKWLPGFEIEADYITLRLFVLQKNIGRSVKSEGFIITYLKSNNNILNVEPTILSQGLWND